MAAPQQDMGSKNEGADTRMGIIQINNLVYKLEPDLSCAVNRTFKDGFFQNLQYSNTQTSIAIFNSGADYIDARRSFLSLTLDFPETKITDANIPTGYINGYFGPNGSILNLIDSVVVSTRSGDELSRINDFAQLMYTYIPWTFGNDWAKTIGQCIGYGSYVGGSNSGGVKDPQYNRRQYEIPLYLLSPVFAYGRLLPSMLMSGLRVEIKWKSLDSALQQYWEGVPRNWPSDSTATEDATAYMTEGKQYIEGLPATNNVLPEYALMPEGDRLSGYWQWDAPHGILQRVGGNPAPNFTEPFPGEDRPSFYPNGQEVICFLDNGVVGANSNEHAVNNPHPAWIRRFLVHGVRSAISLWVELLDPHPALDNDGVDLTDQRMWFDGVDHTLAANTNWRWPATNPGMYRATYLPYPNDKARGFGHLYRAGQGLTPETPLVGYNIISPTFRLCSVQLTDAVQRHLNEYSATNGLELVYADWDRTSQPVEGKSVKVYTEIRKSASRALQCFAVVTNSEANGYTRNSFQNYTGGVWNDVQFQLGSLYFPQQRISDNTSSTTEQKYDNMLQLCYAYTADSWDRFHPKAAPTMMSLRGADLFPWNRYPEYTLPTPEESVPDSYIVPASVNGKYGSFANGGLSIGTTLERSSMFDLSGIPINNSRVLAIRGEYVFPGSSGNGTLYAFLKYVRLARCFLINVEVEQ